MRSHRCGGRRCVARRWRRRDLFSRRHSRPATRKRTTMTMTQREQVIQAAWNERGRLQWDPSAHGPGVPLCIAADTSMRPRGLLGTPILQFDGLEFRCRQSTVNGQIFSVIECEGLVVEPPVIREMKPAQPVRFVSTVSKARRVRPGGVWHKRPGRRYVRARPGPLCRRRGTDSTGIWWS